ncbi:uncharacterized protein V1516DRAFT_669648 [Lipomyces oligophaga]|uniref:uncharacterized protein n=1 Tax=Lipomyces oligophaga TaxID=45792 RepID=UPI0034CDDA17
MTDYDISIQTFSTDPSPKPHIVYHVQVRLPLRSYTVMKRYSEFVKLVDDLQMTVDDDLPFKLPRKHLFGNSVTNLDLAEERKQGLEKFLQEIAKSPDNRWKLTDCWRTFLNLSGSSISGGGSSKGGSSLLSSNSSSNTSALFLPSGKNIADPIVWLDTLHEVKDLLHDARKYLSDRDRLAGSGALRGGALESRSASAEASKSLVQAGTRIVMLDRGLKELSSSVGSGELRRRTDMLNLVRKEKEGLENLAKTVSKSEASQRAAAAAAVSSSSESIYDPDRSALFAGASKNRAPSIMTTASTTSTTASVLGAVTSSAKRVLGPLAETSETRQLDNRGLMSLQMKKMDEQDQALDEMSKILRRQRQLGVDISDELELHSEMLKMLDEDVENSDNKLRRAERQLHKIK